MTNAEIVYHALEQGATSSSEIHRTTGVRQKTANTIINSNIDLYKKLQENKQDARIRWARRIVKLYNDGLDLGLTSEKAAENAGYKIRQIHEYRAMLRENDTPKETIGRIYTSVPKLLKDMTHEELAIQLGVAKNTVNTHKACANNHIVTIDMYDTGSIYSLYTRRS